MRASRPGPFRWPPARGGAAPPDLLRISPFVTLWRALGDHFSDPRLRQLFGRLCHLLRFVALPGAGHADAGRACRAGRRLAGAEASGIAQALVRLAARAARAFPSTPLSAILTRDGRTCGVRPPTAKNWLPTRSFQWRAGSARRRAVGKDSGRATRAVPPPQRSLSALTWNLVARSEGLNCCAIRCSSRATTARVRRHRAPLEAALRAHGGVRAPRIGDETDHRNPTGPERLLLIVNAPARGDTRPFAPEEIARCESDFPADGTMRLRLDPIRPAR